MSSLSVLWPLAAQMQKDAAEAKAAELQVALASERQKAHEQLLRQQERSATELDFTTNSLRGESDELLRVCIFRNMRCCYHVYCNRCGDHIKSSPCLQIHFNLIYRQGSYISNSITSMQGLKEQLQQREDDMIKLETVHKLIVSQLESQLAGAESKVSCLTQQNARLSQRRAMDMEVTSLN